MSSITCKDVVEKQITWYTLLMYTESCVPSGGLT